MQTVRLASEQDAEHLPDVERSSGEAFRQIASLAWIADDAVTPPERHLELIRKGTVWVTQDDSGRIAGFLTAEVCDDALHIWQMSVRADQQKRGIGRMLMRAAEHWALTMRLSALSLTTFRNVPWNAAFYESCGFRIIDPSDHPMLSRTLEAEAQAGLPLEQRCAMMRSL
jgi:GNAT superfamily N-acetyltransferase